MSVLAHLLVAALALANSSALALGANPFRRVSLAALGTGPLAAVHEKSGRPPLAAAAPAAAALGAAALASAVATAFLEDTGLPAYLYRLGKPARQVGPALWTRNLLANRLYQCPVLFCEPYVMNNEEVYNRVQAGDYDGEREVAGKLRKSIYREYRDAVVKGLVNYYSSRPEGNP